MLGRRPDDWRKPQPTSQLAAIAFQYKAAVYDLLFKAAAETLQAIAADPKRLGGGARPGRGHPGGRSLP